MPKGFCKIEDMSPLAARIPFTGEMITVLQVVPFACLGVLSFTAAAKVLAGRKLLGILQNVCSPAHIIIA